jgi:hypothetical protein
MKSKATMVEGRLVIFYFQSHIYNFISLKTVGDR